MRRSAVPAIFALALAVTACGRDVSFAVSARVEGDQLVIEATCDEPTHIAVGERRAMCQGKGEPARISLPAAELGIGTRTIEVVGSFGEGNSKTKKVTVDIPASAIGPYFEITGCLEDGKGESIALLAGDGEDDPGYGATNCYLADGPRLLLRGKANAQATVTIGGVSTTVPANGTFELVAELSEAFLALSIEDLLDDNARPLLRLPWTLDAAGKPLAGTIVFKTVRHADLVRPWLREIVDGKLARPAFTPRAESPTALFVRDRDHFKPRIVATSTRGTVREVSLIAVDTELNRVRAGTCEYSTGLKPVIANRFNADTRIDLLRIADGQRLAPKLFPFPIDCPASMWTGLDETNPDLTVEAYTEDITTWLATLLAPPAATAAPSPE